MVSEEELLKREIRIVKEAIALHQKRSEIGHNDLLESESNLNIPIRYHHLLNQDINRLRDHLIRLEEDLQDHQELENPDRMSNAVEYHEGRKMDEEDGC